MRPTPQTHSFQAEVNEVLSIVVNSLYSHKEVFLRELISNASDALDKLAFLALTQHELAQGHEPAIELIPNKTTGTLTVRDNGVGMTSEEMVQNLGTIARSGTKRFAQALSGDQRKDLTLIGQFGVGFYSSFLVADQVAVVSKPAGGGAAARWESAAKGEFTITDAERDGPGTDVVLHLKPDELDFLEEWTLKSLVRKYSDYVRHPIRLQVERTKDKGKVLEWETVNTARALWARPKSEIAAEQYHEFYKHLSHDWEAPLAWTHFKVEGQHELTGLLFLPAKKPLDLFDRAPRGLRLFVKRVLITEQCEELLPEWLRFVRGVVDSEDLPLNVSRELLQQDRATQFIRKQVVGKVLALLEELAAEGKTTVKDAEGKETEVVRYERLWAEFGPVLKEGVHLEPANRERLAKLLRYRSSHGEGWHALADYRARMQPGQPGIYYVAALGLDTARCSPHSEALRQRGFEVLYLTDPVDEWVVEALREFDGQKLLSAAKGALDLPQTGADQEKAAAQKDAFSALVESVKGTLGEAVSEVRLTNRLTDSPACLVTEAHGLSPHIERILRANGQDVPRQKRILELNPDHAVVQGLRALAGDEAHKAEVAQWAQVLHDQALVAEGVLPEDPSRLSRAITVLLQKAVGERGA